MKTIQSLLAASAAAVTVTSCVEPYPLETQTVHTQVNRVYQPGYTIATLPAGARSVSLDGVRYYSHNDVYYQPRGSGFIVVDPPRQPPATVSYTTYRPGYRVNTLPPGADVVVIGGRRHFRYNDVYFRPSGSEYIVVEGPGRGDWDDDWDLDDSRIVRTLPTGYTVVTHQGQRYYRHGGTYYRPHSSGYVAVNTPF